MSFDAPVIVPACGLDPAWLDYNGHLNMAYYNVLFDRSVDRVFELVGCGPDYLAKRNFSFFTAETHVCYVRELKPDATVSASAQVLDFDARRLHLYQEIRHVDGWLSATCETLLVHIDMSGPRVIAMPEDILAAITEMAGAHRDLPRPDRAGRSVQIVRRPEDGAD